LSNRTSAAPPTITPRRLTRRISWHGPASARRPARPSDLVRWLEAVAMAFVLHCRVLPGRYGNK